MRMKSTERVYAMKILHKWEMLKRAEVSLHTSQSWQKRPLYSRPPVSSTHIGSYDCLCQNYSVALHWASYMQRSRYGWLNKCGPFFLMTVFALIQFKGASVLIMDLNGIIWHLFCCLDCVFQGGTRCSGQWGWKVDHQSSLRFSGWWVFG